MFNRGYSRDVTVLPTHWLGGKRRVASLRSVSDTVAEGSVMGEQCNLAGSEQFYGVMMHIDFQESRWCFLGHGGAVDLFGGRQASLYWLLL